MVVVVEFLKAVELNVVVVVWVVHGCISVVAIYIAILFISGNILSTYIIPGKPSPVNLVLHLLCTFLPSAQSLIS